MQKKLLTLAVAGALGVPAGMALAQTGVEVYGTVNMSFGNVKYSGATGGTPSVSKWDVANGASNYGLRGRESLGGGLTAWYQIEQNAPLERSNNVAITPASRNSAIGLQGGFGNVFMGQWTTPWADLDSLWSVGTVGFWGPVTSIIGRRETTGVAPNPNCVNTIAATGTAATTPICDAVESGGGVGHPFWRRVSNAVFYQSSVMGGAQFKLAYQTNEGKAVTALTTSANPSMWSASGQWAGMGGAARIGAAIDRHKDFTILGKTDAGYAVKGGWNFGVADIGLAWERNTYKQATSGDAKVSQYGLAVAVPIGGDFVRGSYAKATDIKNVAGNQGAKTYNLGYEHRFSKRTQVGVGYATIKNESAAGFIWTGLPPDATGVNNAGLAGQDIKTFFLNMITRF
jgi:predicted porin